MLRNRREQVDGHGLRISLARKLERRAVIDLVADRLAGFDGFLEARRGRKRPYQ